MFEHFDERARTCVVFAQEEARRLGHEELGTVHLLLGVLHVSDTLAARLLREHGIDEQRLREALGPTHPPDVRG